MRRGKYRGPTLDGAGALHGFLRDASGTITLFEDPNAATGSEQGTIATAIDAAGDIVGAYIDANNAIHGYLRKASTGAFTTIDAADAGTLTYQGTYPDAFDEAGDIFAPSPMQTMWCTDLSCRSMERSQPTTLPALA